MLDRDIFYHKYRQHFGPLNQSQTNGLNFLLQELDDSTVLTDAREYSYILATILHECAGKWQPITEYGSQAYLRGKRYYPFIGRGFVQITWESNYQNFSKILGIDLVAHPEKALEPAIAWKICEYGFVHGSFTGKKLSNYFNDNITDWVMARKIINGLDCANLIGGYAQKFYDCIEFVATDNLENEVKPEIANAVDPDEDAAQKELIAHKALIAEIDSMDSNINLA